MVQKINNFIYVKNNFLFFTFDFGVKYNVGMFFLAGMLLPNIFSNSYIIVALRPLTNVLC